MRTLRYIALLAVLIFCGEIKAQFTISKIRPKELLPSMYQDSVRATKDFKNDYFSLARWKAEKRRIRHERNTFEFQATAQAAQTQYDNWAAGGDNTFTGRATIYTHHLFSKNKFSFDTKFQARYGMNIISGDRFKNEDEFKLNLASGWSFHRNWSYAATVAFRSQFSTGYKSRTDHTRASTFMAPGYLDLAVGFQFKNSTSPFEVTLSPVGGSIVFMLDSELSAQGLNGVEAGKKAKTEVGPSVRVFFDKKFVRETFRYRSEFYTFTNIENAPTARWENTLEIKATKALSTTVYALFFYDKSAETPRSSKMQYNYSFSVGLSYTFKNK